MRRGLGCCLLMLAIPVGIVATLILSLPGMLTGLDVTSEQMMLQLLPNDPQQVQAQTIVWDGTARDTRCPAGLACPDGGEAMVILSINGTIHRLRFNGWHSDRVEVGAGLVVQIAAVEPYPNTQGQAYVRVQVLLPQEMENDDEQADDR